MVPKRIQSFLSKMVSNIFNPTFFAAKDVWNVHISPNLKPSTLTKCNENEQKMHLKWYNEHKLQPK